MELILVNWGIEIIGAVGAVIATYIAKKIGNKLGVEAQEATERMLDRVAEKAVQYTEEQAAKLQKQLGEKVESNEKLATAVEFMNEAVTPYVKAKYGKEWETAAKREIESALGRIEKAGATGLNAFIAKLK